MNLIETIRLHITYTNDLTLLELSNLIREVDIAINDINRDHFQVKRNETSKYETKVFGVEKGSIILDLAVGFAGSLLASLLVEGIKARFNKQKAESKKIEEFHKKIDVDIVQDDNRNEIHIHVEK